MEAGNSVEIIMKQDGSWTNFCGSRKKFNVEITQKWHGMEWNGNLAKLAYSFTFADCEIITKCDQL